MEAVFGNSSREDRAVEQLSERGEVISQQDGRVPILNKKITRVHKDAKDPLDLGSTSKLQMERYGNMLCDVFDDDMADSRLQTPQQYVLGRIVTKEDKKLKHSMHGAEEQDLKCAREARSRGLGNVYWEQPHKIRPRKLVPSPRGL